MTRQQRLFFALWPDDQVRQQMVAAFRQAPQFALAGRKMQPANLHMTLHFIGNVDTEKRDCLHQAAQTVRAKPCQLQLDRFGHFYQARVFWLGCQHIPEELQALYRDLGEALSACDYQLEHRPYAPHITLMRKLLKPGGMMAPQPITWSVEEFVLVESVPVPQGVEYRVIQHYPLSR